MIASLLAFEYWWVFSSVASSRPALRLMIRSASQNVFLDKTIRKAEDALRESWLLLKKTFLLLLKKKRKTTAMPDVCIFCWACLEDVLFFWLFYGRKKKCCSDAMEIVCHDSQDGGNLLHLFQSSFPSKIFLLICFHREFVTMLVSTRGKW